MQYSQFVCSLNSPPGQQPQIQENSIFKHSALLPQALTLYQEHRGKLPRGAWGLVAPGHVGSSPTRDRTSVPCIAKWILNHWITRKPFSAVFGASQLLPCRTHVQLLVPVSPPLVHPPLGQEVNSTPAHLQVALLILCLASLSWFFLNRVTNSLLEILSTKILKSVSIFRWTLADT